MQKLDCENVQLGNAKGNGRMDLEEQRLKHQIEAREMALKQKINLLRERIERFKRMADVKSKVQQRPGLMLMGSILAGFLTKKLVIGKNRHSPSLYHTDSRPVPMSGTATGAIVSAIASRAAIGIISEIASKLVPRRHQRGQSQRDFSNN